MEHRVKLEILRELGSLEKLKKSLDVVEVVLGFLTSEGGKPKMKLISYLRQLKMDNKPFSQKVNELLLALSQHFNYFCVILFLQAIEVCNLDHILSLWQTLSVGLAQYITISGQVYYSL